jgi:hypothetical protein
VKDWVAIHAILMALAQVVLLGMIADGFFYSAAQVRVKL